MAAVAGVMAMDFGEQKPLHPFFTKQKCHEPGPFSDPEPHVTSSEDLTNNHSHGVLDRVQENNHHGVYIPNREDVGNGQQSSTYDFTTLYGPVPTHTLPMNYNMDHHTIGSAVHFGEDLNFDRRKRRKTSPDFGFQTAEAVPPNPYISQHQEFMGQPQIGNQAMMFDYYNIPTSLSGPSYSYMGQYQEFNGQPPIHNTAASFHSFDVPVPLPAPHYTYSDQYQALIGQPQITNQVATFPSSDVFSSLPVHAQYPFNTTQGATNLAPIGLGHYHVDENQASTPETPEANTVENRTRSMSLTDNKEKKMLKINSAGRLGSPVPISPPTSEKQKKKARFPKRKSNRLIVIMKYSANKEKHAEIGQKINKILGPEKGKDESKIGSKPNVPKLPFPSKGTHPFFLGKTIQKDEKSTDVPKVLGNPPVMKELRSSATPRRPRSQARDMPPNVSFAPSEMVDQANILKHPGMSEAPWPWKGGVHLRGLSDSEKSLNTVLQSIGTSPESQFTLRRKRKETVITVQEEESVLSSKFYNWGVDTVNPVVEKEELRLPERLLTTGPAIQSIVQKELCASSNHGLNTNTKNHVHPALVNLFDRIQGTLTAFDRAECETRTWAQKYAPQNTGEVLQTGKEALVLRDWLRSLIVNSVEDSLGASSKNSTNKGTASKAAKKKRRKNDDMDDFIVDIEEPSSEMEELTDMEDANQEDFTPKRKKSTVYKSSEKWNGGNATSRKTRNAVLLSGPHGCGKTAMVHAVAKELGFEIFEINAGSRRNGKDILDKVGNMTENHLVQQTATMNKHKVELEKEPEVGSEAIQKDVESGRQGTMTSFFKSAAKKDPKVSDKPSISKTRPSYGKINESESRNSGPRNQQKQSLILLEEVDILFEEDKPFWSTVVNLIATSKRPIVMTCNNENLVYLQEVALHAILRVSPPSVDLATDYMLLMAACEGHILERTSVSSLYRAKDRDLRASIMELNFWCQMAIGDTKGGLEWFYQRWPPCKDVDEHGCTLRVASKGTYKPGMGWFGRDGLLVQQRFKDKYLESNRLANLTHGILLDLWELWGVGLEEWLHPDPSSTKMEMQCVDHEDRSTMLQNLEQYDMLLSNVSDVDICCRISLPSGAKDIIDATLPELPEKAQTNYVDGSRLLAADPILDYANMDIHVATSIYQLTRQAIPMTAGLLRGSPHVGHGEYTEPYIVEDILAFKSRSHTARSISRLDFAEAFDILAEPPSTIIQQQLTASSWDRNFRIISEELAPYVRNIVSSDLRLEAQRLRLSNLLSVRGPKRVRTTRASRSALEGSQRRLARRDRWFTRDLNLALAMRTGGKEWAGIGSQVDDDSLKETASIHSMEE